MIFPTLASAPPLSASCRSTRSCHSLRLMRYPTRAEILVLHRAMLEQSGGTPGIRDLGARHAALAQPRRHGDLSQGAWSPPLAATRAERHATRLVALGTRVVLDCFYPGGRRVVQYRTLTFVLASLSHPPGTFSAAPNSARRFVDGDGHHLVSPLAPFQFLS